jgi:urease accessory protein
VSSSSQLLRLLHLASPALPIGAFHFSQGMEYAVEAGWVRNEATALEWIEGLAHNALGSLDLPILLRLKRACAANDGAAVKHWALRMLASRETEELRAEDRHMGNALARILVDLGVIPLLAEDEQKLSSYPLLFARACSTWRISELETLQTYAWTWVENQTLAAVKLVPLGQSAGQRILHSLIPQLQSIVDRAIPLADEDIGTSGVMQAFASARHESQYTRLFRS